MAATVQTAETEVPEVSQPTVNPLWDTAAELFAQGMTRSEVARKMEWHLLTPLQRKYKPIKRRMLAMRKLRRMQKRKDFRDLVWAAAVTRLDTRVPKILEGVADRATNGRVDAAKLSLELAGRYTPRGQEVATQVAIVVNSVPRPVVKAQAVEADGQRELESG